MITYRFIMLHMTQLLHSTFCFILVLLSEFCLVGDHIFQLTLQVMRKKGRGEKTREREGGERERERERGGICRSCEVTLS